jgi:predicted GNAT family N-acyltransferase
LNVIIAETDQQLEDGFHVRREVFIKEQHVPEEEEIDGYEEEATHFVLYDDQAQPVGAGRLRTISTDVGKIERICIMKQARDTGAGKLLMESIESFAHKVGVHKLKLNAQTHAEGFYERLGFKTVSERFFDAGIPHVTMVKTIES